MTAIVSAQRESPPGGTDRAIDATSRNVGRRVGGVLLLVALLVALSLLSLVIGSKALTLDEVWTALISSEPSEARHIVLQLRGPRTLAAIVVGIALGLAGGLIQAITRNPLGDPGILGVNAGAVAAVTAGAAFFGTTSIGQDLWFGLGGALAVSAAVGLIGARGGTIDPIRLTLAGVAIAAVLAGTSAALRLTDYETFRRLRTWDAGSFVERDLGLTLSILPMVVIGAVLALLLAHPLNAVALGDDLAVALGAKLLPTRLGAIVAIAILCGAATALAGPIAFVGLMVPHLARWITGPNQLGILPIGALIAPSILLIADLVGRVILWPGEVPAGIVTAFIGAPVLILLVRRTKASAL